MTKRIMFFMAALLVVGCLAMVPRAVQAQAESIQVEQDDSESSSEGEWRYVPVRRFATVEGSAAEYEADAEAAVELVADDSGEANFDGQLLTVDDFRSEQQY